MAWDALGFLEDLRIPYERQRPGWVNVRCPLCEDHASHGGFYLEDGHYHCWRCGGHWLPKVVAALLGRSLHAARELYEKYERYTKVAEQVRRKAASGNDFKLPGDDLGKYHIRYLEQRGFNAAEVVHRYGLRGTGPIARAFDMDWALRLVIPIHDINGRLVACQGRDISNKSKLRYTASPIEKSLMDYKDTLYAGHLVRGDSVYVVEGVFDAIRLGAGFVATFGTQLSKAQLKELRRWRHVGFIFDPEPEAQAKARKYATELDSVGVSAELISLDTGGRDPAELTPLEVLEVRNSLGLKNF